MKPALLGIVGGMLLGPALIYLYDGFATGLLNCSKAAPEFCAAAESRIAWSAAALVVGLVVSAVALRSGRRSAQPS